MQERTSWRRLRAATKHTKAFAADKMRSASPEEQKSMMAEYEKKFDEAPQRISPPNSSPRALSVEPVCSEPAQFRYWHFSAVQRR